MSDNIHRSDQQCTDLVDTVSFYNDSEPNWDERPYFSAVEAARGKSGIHVDASSRIHSFDPPIFSECQALTPGLHSASLHNERNFNALLVGKGYRAILSGIGGDEVLGGVPTPTPELADYLTSGNIVLFLKRATEWSLVNRDPILQTIVDTVTTTRKLYLGSLIEWDRIPPWLTPRLRAMISDLPLNSLKKRGLRGVSPTAICNGLAWWSVMDTMPHTTPSLLLRYEYRFPYLDRDLVNFLFRIPREQIVRPGRRRSLMRRSLKNIVPDTILERRRKAYCIRKPLLSIQEGQDRIRELFNNSRAVDLGFVDRAQICNALDLTIEGRDIRWLNSLGRAIAFELWLISRDQAHLSSSTVTREPQTLLL
jgi:asparagine synthase (glutamine-hydrolysing)